MKKNISVRNDLVFLTIKPINLFVSLLVISSESNVLLKCKLNKHSGKEDLEHFKIPKDVSKLPVLSMLIKDNIQKTETKEEIKSSLLQNKHTPSKIFETENKTCSIHKNEKLRYLCEDPLQFLCVYWAFEQKQSHPHIIITEIEKSLSKLLHNFQCKLHWKSK